MGIARTIAATLLCVSAAMAQDTETAPIETTEQFVSGGPAGVYRTRASASFSDPCTGSAFVTTSRMLGTFELIGDPATTPGTPQHFRVVGACFVIERNTGDIVVSGEGEYVLIENMGAPPAHRMTLTVSVDGGPDRTFDSGMVPLTALAVNGIDLTLVETPALCNVPAVITMHTSLVPHSLIREYTLVKSMYTEDCLPGCPCPPLMAGAVLGTFDLVPIASLSTALAPSNRHSLYAVRNVDWLIAESSGGVIKGVPVSGKGFFRRNYDATALTGATQRMELELEIGAAFLPGSGTFHFDSGWVKIAPLTSVGGIQITLPEAVPACPKTRTFEIVAIP